MQGKVVIVTGGAKGIGRHAATTLAKAGAKVVLADTDAERLQQTLKELREIGVDALAIPTDVRDEINVRAMVHQTAERFGQIDALINDAASCRILIGVYRAGRGCVLSARISGTA